MQLKSAVRLELSSWSNSSGGSGEGDESCFDREPRCLRPRHVCGLAYLELPKPTCCMSTVSHPALRFAITTCLWSLDPSALARRYPHCWCARRQHSARSSISATDAGAQQQTHRPPLLLSLDETDDRCIGLCSAYIDNFIRKIIAAQLTQR